MSRDVSPTPILVTQEPNDPHCMSVARCSCARPTADHRVRRSLTGGALTVCGLLGWVCVPKCPLCLAAYVAVGSGITLTFAQGAALRYALLGFAAVLILAGTWFLAKSAFRAVA
ncbi:MAG: hypothetical protein QM811_18155 [Pirellulales bacterium]